MSRLAKAIRDPKKALEAVLMNKKISRIIPDKTYLKWLYRLTIGKKLDLDDPRTFNEKLQWLKLYNRKDLYTTLVDKYAVKQYISEKIGAQYVIPTLGVWNDPEEIDFDSLPERFVLKCNHNSGLGMFICKDKSLLNPAQIEQIKINLRKGLKEDKYLQCREWPYKNVPRKIFAEEYMEDEETHELRDYKFFAFDGKVKALFIASERQNKNAETKFDFFDENGNHLPFVNGHPNAAIMPKLPTKFDEMKRLAGFLSQGIPEVRIDFYEVNGRIYFGEMTFFHWSGLKPFIPEEWDGIFGDWIHLPQIEEHQK